MTPAQPPAGSWMSQMPGAVAPNAPAVVAKKKLGLVPVKPNSGHMITVGGKDGEPTQRVQTIARDPQTVPGAKSRFVCLHQGCANKSWESEAAMRGDHPEPRTMEKQQVIHLYACYSNDPIDPKDKAKGVVGLIAPASPAEAS